MSCVGSQVRLIETILRVCLTVSWFSWLRNIKTLFMLNEIKLRMYEPINWEIVTNTNQILK
jgi:hypothetical protein